MDKIINEIPSEIKDGLESLQLLGPISHLLMMSIRSGNYSKLLLKSERARVLGLGKDIPKIYEKKAQRESATAIRQLTGISAAFKDKLNDSEWLDYTKKFITKSDINRVVSDARERVVESLLDIEVSGSEAKKILEAWDSGAKELSKNGVPGVIKWLSKKIDTRLVKSERTRDRNKLAKDAHPAECIAIATGVYLAMLTVCGYVPFCWCCYSGAIHTLYIAMLKGCAG